MPANPNVDTAVRAEAFASVVASMRAQAGEYESFAGEVGGLLANVYRAEAESLRDRADRIEGAVRAECAA